MDQRDQGGHGAEWWTGSPVVPLLHFVDGVLEKVLTKVQQVYGFVRFSAHMVQI